MENSKTSTQSLKQKIHQTQRDTLSQGWSSLVNRSVHDLSNLAVSVRSVGEFLLEVLPYFIKSYDLALKHNLMKPAIEERLLNHVKKFPNRLEEIATETFDLLSILRTFNGDLLSKEKIQTLSAKKFITELLENYPFKNSGEKEWIKTDFTSDFQFESTQFFSHHLFHRLLDKIYKPDLFAKNETVPKKDEISISFVENEDHNIIVIQSPRLSKNKIATITNSFFISQAGKILPGFGYCRLALLQLGGDVIFDSIEKISVKFPKLIE